MFYIAQEDRLTEKEVAWLERLQRLLDKQPEGIDLIVRAGSWMTVTRPDWKEIYYQRDPNLDIELTGFQTKIIPDSESL